MVHEGILENEQQDSYLMNEDHENVSLAPFFKET